MLRRVLFSRCRRSHQYLNSTLADWLGYDLAEFRVRQHPAFRYRPGRRREPIDARSRRRRIRTEIIDIDLVRRNGTTLPVRLLHRAARLADGELGETRTLVLDRSRSATARKNCARRRSAFAFFNDTPFAIATLDSAGRIIRTNAPSAAFSTGRAGEEHRGAAHGEPHR